MVDPIVSCVTAGLSISTGTATGTVGGAWMVTGADVGVTVGDSLDEQPATTRKLATTNTRLTCPIPPTHRAA